MSGLPDFLSIADDRKHFATTTASVEHCYQPLLAAWAIEIMLQAGLPRKMISGKHYLIKDNDDIGKLTGLSTAQCDDVIGDEQALILNGKKIPRTAAAIAKEFAQHAALFRRQPVSDEFHIFENVRLLGGVLRLNRAEQAVLCFATMLHVAHMFRGAIGLMDVRLPLSRVAAIIAQLTGNEEKEILAALQPEATLRTFGIIAINDTRFCFEDVLTLMSGFGVLLSQPHASTDALIGKFLCKTSSATLSQQDYPHLMQDATVLSAYLASVVRRSETGSNVLLYGIPGTGKTEFAKVLAATLGTDLYEIVFEDENGEPVTGNARLRAYNLCQRILAGHGNALLMFDEVEDVFPSRGILQMLLSGEEDGGGRNNAKAWVNRSLEQNRTPAIWITNNANIDKAYLRRFDYSVRFAVPPLAVRREIARRHLAVFAPDEEWLTGIAVNEQLTPAQYDRAAKVARLGAQGDTRRAQELVEQTLDRSATLLGQKKMPARNVRHTRYDIRFVNASLPLERILEGLGKHRAGTFCFYGPAGTGKSEFARHIADSLGMPCIVRRASDILGKWVGETEQNIAGMFTEARQQEAVLVLDEADSFLADRRDARNGWEVTQVNELLTQMEAFEGIFVSTTNLMDRLDQASLRRFAFKVKFDCLNADQRYAMFMQELQRLGGDLLPAVACESAVRSLEQLTPGDFAVAARQFTLYGEPATAATLLAQLKEECRVKGGSLSRMGF